MREVTGYYFMNAWRYRSRVHSIIIIAPEREQAKEVLRQFLNSRGYSLPDVMTLKPVRNISSTATVIVADFYNVPSEE